MPCPRPHGEATFQTCPQRSHGLCPDPSERCGPCGCGGSPASHHKLLLLSNSGLSSLGLFPPLLRPLQSAPHSSSPALTQLSHTHLLTMPPTATGPGMPSLPQITLSAASKTIRQQRLQQDRGFVPCPISEAGGVCCPNLQSDQAPYLSAPLSLA